MTMFTLAARAYDFQQEMKRLPGFIVVKNRFDHRTLCVGFTKTNGAG